MLLMQSTHKLHADGGELVLNLSLVAKRLHMLKKEWCPEAFVISFKGAAFD